MSILLYTYTIMQSLAFVCALMGHTEGDLSGRQAMAIFAFWPILLPAAGFAGLWQFWEEWQDQRALRAKERELKLEHEYRRIAAEIRDSE